MGNTNERDRSKQQDEKSAHVAEGPGGAAQFDRAQQSEREDMEDDEGDGRGQPTRGNLPPGASKQPRDSEAPKVPGSAVDRGEKPRRDGQRGA